MPSSKTITVERLTEGSRRVLLEFAVPHDNELVVLEEADHAHLVYGLPEELVAHALKAPPKPKAERKPAAKKPAAKKAPAKKAPARKAKA